VIITLEKLVWFLYFCTAVNRKNIFTHTLFWRRCGKCRTVAVNARHVAYCAVCCFSPVSDFNFRATRQSAQRQRWRRLWGLRGRHTFRYNDRPVPCGHFRFCERCAFAVRGQLLSALQVPVCMKPRLLQSLHDTQCCLMCYITWCVRVYRHESWTDSA